MKTTRKFHIVMDEEDLAEAIYWYLKNQCDMPMPLSGADDIEVTTTNRGVEVEWTTPETQS